MIETNMTVKFSLEEVCDIAQLPTEVLITIVEEGVIEPKGSAPEEWCFDCYMLNVAKRASRLHRDFGLDWTGMPLYLDMLEQLEKLREENKRLRQQLGRFLLD
ncbi:MAG: chaperone modulatory protein CbpM [Proteobacteria bacterium]|nr:chaperone modulatory protein CbpM [Pseudomonadota bacterium]NOG60068.1 chaperone modulatory protein CbpM [Pseudomonadota bacterium]